MESLGLQSGCALAGDQQERGSDATSQVLPGLLAVVTNSAISHSPHPLPTAQLQKNGSVMRDLNGNMLYNTLSTYLAQEHIGCCGQKSISNKIGHGGRC